MTIGYATARDATQRDVDPDRIRDGAPVRTCPLQPREAVWGSSRSLAFSDPRETRPSCSYSGGPGLPLLPWRLRRSRKTVSRRPRRSNRHRHLPTSSGTSLRWPDGTPPTKTERTEKQAEGDAALSLSEEQVAIGGGGHPVAGKGAPSNAPPVAGAFVDRGRRDTIAFGEAVEQGFDREGGDVDPGVEDLRPRVFIAGGRTGKAAWGGGAGAGPHGNQESGSAELVSPEIETRWGGAFSNADAWVKDGTGTVTVKRDYVSSDAGDQGNGWYITDKAAAGLDRHEQRHVAQSRALYADRIQPMLDRIIMSYQYGKGKVYKSVDAAQLVRRYVDWAGAVKGFDEDDKAWNGKSGQVDQDDQYSPNFPRQIGAGKVNGKEFKNRLKMPSEDAPPE